MWLMNLVLQVVYLYKMWHIGYKILNLVQAYYIFDHDNTWKRLGGAKSYEFGFYPFLIVSQIG